MDWITEDIAIGNYEDAQGDRPKKAGVTAVLNLCLEREDFPEGREFERNGIIYAKVPLFDAPRNSSALLTAAIVVLKDLLDRGHRVLVHCGAGVSRSPTIVYLYLTWYRGWSAEAAENLIRSKRPQVSSKFADFTRLLERKK